MTSGFMAAHTQNPVHDLPPHYTDISEELPLTFQVGRERVSPLVNVTELQAHLRLLQAFRKLKDDVHHAHSPIFDVNDLPNDKNRAWVVFVNRAVYRFDKFMSGAWTDWPPWSESCIPPLDVIMVWHTYLLNPRVYHEDSIRRTTPFARRLSAMESMPLTLIASLIDPTTGEPVPPSAQRETFFETTSGLPFMYSFTTSTSDTVSLPCPCCNTINRGVKWITPEGNTAGEGAGFAEPNFVHQCEWCSEKFTRTVMGIRKFAEEVTRKRAMRKVYFPETLLQPLSGKPDEMAADVLYDRLLRRLNTVLKLNTPVAADDISVEAISLGKSLDWNPQVLAIYLHQGLCPRKPYSTYESPLPRIQRLLAAYSTPGYASIDLVAAVLRQSTFIGKVNDLRWLDVGRFVSGHSQGILRCAIARYHAFLDLMSANPDSFYVPTLDIDLVWHTHQLSATAYRVDTQRLLDRIPNHDDTVQPMTLQHGYDTTASAWKSRFGVPYSLCGCMPDPPPKPFDSILKAMNVPDMKPSNSFKFLKRSSSMKSNPPIRVPVSPRTRDDLVTKDLTDADASHPSDHNLHLEDPSQSHVQSDLISRELASRQRMQAIKKDLERNGRDDSAVDEWRQVQAERKRDRTDHNEAFTRREGLNAEYHLYWGVSTNVPKGFFGAMKYENAVGGCGTGCASCAAPLRTMMRVSYS